MILDHIPGDIVKVNKDGVIVEMTKAELIKIFEESEQARQEELAKSKKQKDSKPVEVKTEDQKETEVKIEGQKEVKEPKETKKPKEPKESKEKTEK